MKVFLNEIVRWSSKDDDGDASEGKSVHFLRSHEVVVYFG